MNRSVKLIQMINDVLNREEYFWLSKIDLTKVKIDVKNRDRAIPLTSVKDIYSFRGQRNKERGDPIKGFETFLSNLDKTKSESVVVHSMVDRYGFEYNIFTDPDLRQLLGILRFRHPDLRKSPLD